MSAPPTRTSLEIQVNSGKPTRLHSSTLFAQHRPARTRDGAQSLGSSMIAHGNKFRSILGLALILSATHDAFGDDATNIRVYNDTADEIAVTVYDMNARPPEAVLVRQTIDGFAWIPAVVTPGLEGSGHVRWSAETTGTSFHRCGHAESQGLANDAMLHVFTDSDC
jgi:hypothetical protein